MPKGKSTTNSRNSSGRSSKSSSSKLNSPTPGRPKPMAPMAGVTVNRRRYEKGGGWCW